MEKQNTYRQTWCCYGWETHTALGSTHRCHVVASICCGPGSAHVPVLLCTVFPLFQQCSTAGFFFFFLLVLRKMSAAGGRQPEGEEELALDARYGERCGFPERSSKGLLRVLRAFLILSKVQHFLRKELILTDIKGHQHTDMCEHVLRPAAQHGSPEPQPSLPPLPPCQSQGCFSCSTVLLAAVNLYCLT